MHNISCEPAAWLDTWLSLGARFRLLGLHIVPNLIYHFNVALKLADLMSPRTVGRSHANHDS